MHPIPSHKPKKHKEKSRQRQHGASSSLADADADTDAHAAVTPPHPPPNAEPDGCCHIEFGDFDFDAVNAEEGGELWLVRAPSSVKAKSLNGLEVPSLRTGLVGDFVRKNAAYDLWALEPPASVDGAHGGKGGEIIGGRTAEAEAGGGALVGVGAEELHNLSVLLPCKRKGGKLFLAPKPITRHLVVVSRPPNPSKPEATASSDSALGFENPKREAYPEEALTHRFRPYGDPGNPPPEDHHVDVDVDTAEVSPKAKERLKRKGGETGSSKKKKAKLVAS